MVGPVGGASVDLTPGDTYIKYTDQNQTVNMTSASTFSVTNVSGSDSDMLVEPAETHEIKILDLGGQLAFDLVGHTAIN